MKKALDYCMREGLNSKTHTNIGKHSELNSTGVRNTEKTKTGHRKRWSIISDMYYYACSGDKLNFMKQRKKREQRIMHT
jgi:hypothetical protein